MYARGIYHIGGLPRASTDGRIETPAIGTILRHRLKGQAFSCQVSYENQNGYFTTTLTPFACKSNGFPT